jgi:uncharacterized radical SAM superfamily Fe-S cluster-containing enzyme
MTRLINVDDYLSLAVNRSLPDLSVEIGSALKALWSMSAAAGSAKMLKSLTCVACSSLVQRISRLDFAAEHFFGIQVHGFMDEHNFDLKRLMKCCVHQLLPDGRAVPFCAYNTLGYRQQAENYAITAAAGDPPDNS